jgi:methionine-rich copper-binding protein CopC
MFGSTTLAAGPEGYFARVGTPNTTVTSIVPTGANPTNATSVTFTVTFAASVTGVTATNFATVNGGGVTGSSIASVSGSGTTYSVVVNTGNGSGTVGLNLANDTGLTPSISNEPFTGQTVTIDKTAPTVASVAVPANGTYRIGQTLSFTVNFSEAATVTGTPQLALTIGSTTRQANYASGSGSTALVFSYTIVSGDLDTDGVALNSTNALALNGGTIRDAVGNNATLTLNGVPSTAGILVDAVVPTVAITSSAGANNSTTTTTPIPFTVTFSESVTGFIASEVTVTGGSLSSFLGSGSTYTFNVTPSGGPVTVNIAANVAQDAAGNGNTAAPLFSITYQAPVTVTSVTRLALSPTATPTVTYQVVFSGSVNGVAPGNFTATSTSGAISGASVTGVSGTGTTYTVTVNTGTGNGTLRLDVANGTNISPSVTNVPYTAGEEYTVTKSFAAAPLLRIQAAGSNSGNGDVTAFVDVVQVLQSGTSTAVANALQNASFETNNVDPSSFRKASDAVAVVANPWTFTSTAGVSRNNSAFVSVAADGDAVALIQSLGNNNASISQNLAVPTGSYQVRFRVIQRNYTSLDQRLNVFVNDVFVGNIQPNNIPTYDTFTSTAFNVTAPALTATVSTTSASPTSTAPIPFSVSFSQSVGTTFTAADVTVAGGTLTSGSFSGSGAGPYTFTVTPSGTGPVTASLAANVVNDANNTGNTASNAVSVQYNQPQTAAPVVTVLANGAFVNTAMPTYAGTAPAGSNVTVYVDNTSIGTTTANAVGNWSIGQPVALSQGRHTVYATAQSSGALVSANSNANTFTVDSQRPTVAISSTTVASGGTTTTSPVLFTVNFSENVTGFVAGDVTVSNGAITTGSFSGAGSTYTFSVTPTTTGTATTVSIAANVAIDQAGNNNTAAAPYSFTFAAPTITVNPATLPNGTQGVAYSQTLTASGGTAPYSYVITAGALPAGLSLMNGTIAGTPTASSTFNFTITATDASAAPGPYSGSTSYSLAINTQPVTAAPVVTTPANGSQTKNQLPTYLGTAPANSTVTVYVGLNSGTASAIGTTTASAGGTFSLAQPATLADGVYQVYATAQTSGSAVSANSNTNAFTVDTTAPTVALSSTTVANGGTTTTSPVSFTATFSESVAGLTAAGLTVTNGTATSGPTAGANNTYTFQVTPSAAGTVTVRVAANAAQDQATNGNTASALYSLTFAAPAIVVSPAALPNGQQGTAYSQALTATGGTAPYSYVITAGALPTGLSLTNGTIAGTPTANGTFNFTITATDASAAPGPYSGSRTYSLAIAAPAVTAVSWNGSMSTDWFTATNWTPNQLPDATINVTIPTSPSGGLFPVISSGTATTRSLTLSSGATLRMSNGTLDVQGSWTNNGTFAATGGTVQLGQQTGNIFGSSTTTFWNLTTTGSSVNLLTSAGAAVRRVLTTNTPFNTNGNLLTMLSDASGTAMAVNPNPSIGVVGTSNQIQRYIDPTANAGLGYRHLASPTGSRLNTQGTTFGNLMTTNFMPIVNPDYNTSTTPGTTRPFPNIFGYDQGRLATVSNNYGAFDKGFYSPAALSEYMASGLGYTVNIAAGQTLTFQGALSYGDITRNLSRNAAGSANEADAGWQLLGNPYPSPYDYSLQAANDRQNLDAAIYVLQSTSQYAGQYRAIVNGVGGNAVLPLGQAFFARVSQGQTSGSITYRNANRVITYQNPAYQRTVETRPLVQLTLQGTGSVLTDAVNVYFEAGATAGVESAYDAVKLPNPTGLNLSTSAQGQQLAIDGQAALGSTQRVLPLVVGVPAAGSYTLNAAQLLNLDAVPVYLRDLLSGALVDLRQQPSYQFTVSNATTAVQGRFELVFSPQQPLATLPAALAQQVSVYPNPAATQVTLELPQSLSRQPVTVALVDALGRVVRQQALPVGVASHTLLLNGLSTGMYALRITTEAGLLVKKLVIK